MFRHPLALTVVTATLLVNLAHVLPARSSPPERTNWYFGVGAGMTNLRSENQIRSDVSDDLASIGSSLDTFDMDERDFGAKGYLGYRLFSGLALEVGFAGLGESEYSGTASLSGTTVNFEGATDVEGWTFSGVTRTPPWHGFFATARGGLFLWDSKNSTTVTTTGTDLTSTNDGLDYTYGIGLGYELPAGDQIRLGAERYVTEDLEIDLYSLNIVFQVPPL